MSSIEVSNLCVLTAKVSQAVLVIEKSLVPVIRLQFIMTQTKVVPKLLIVKTLQDAKVRLYRHREDKLYTSLRKRKRMRMRRRKENQSTTVTERTNAVLTRKSLEHQKELFARQDLHEFPHFPPNRHSTLCLTLRLSHQVILDVKNRWSNLRDPKRFKAQCGRIHRNQGRYRWQGLLVIDAKFQSQSYPVIFDLQARRQASPSFILLSLFPSQHCLPPRSLPAWLSQWRLQARSSWV
jgi:hypothetical protein